MYVEFESQEYSVEPGAESSFHKGFPCVIVSYELLNMLGSTLYCTTYAKEYHKV